jgi:hypothetical protein
LLLLGCNSDPESAEPQTELEPAPCPGAATLPPSLAADGFVATIGLEFESCGREYLDVRSDCCEPLVSGYECLLRALEACSLARFAEVYSTIEGALILKDYFVVPAAGGCELMLMTDSSRDPFRGSSAAAVQTTYCSRASVGMDGGSPCPRLIVDDCGS